MSNSLNAFSRRIGHTFDDPGLLELAMTHRSYGGQNNERLEFLGDSIVNFIIAEAQQYGTITSLSFEPPNLSDLFRRAVKR